MKKTLIDLFEESVAKYGNNTFLLEKKTTKFEPTTYAEAHEQALAIGGGLMAMGIEPKERISILSEGCNDWIVSELGLLYAACISVPLSIKLEEANDLYFRLWHAEVSTIFVSPTQIHKIRAIRSRLPLLKNVIIMGSKAKAEEEGEILLSELMEKGREWLKTGKEKLIALSQSIQNDDYATITYTSGTTADPKGVVLTHRNYTSNVEQALTRITIPEGWRTLIILPLDHCFAHVAGFYIMIARGAAVATTQVGATPMETLRNVPLNIREVKPHFLLSVPALAKNFRKNIESSIRAKGPTTEKLFNLALKTAYCYNQDAFTKGKGWRFILKPAVWFFDKILFSKVREAFGGELRFFVGGGALLDSELQRFFYAIGIPMFQGYGLSEATPIISANSPWPKSCRFGSSGKVLKGIDLKIKDADGNDLPVGEKGEIVIYGENVMAGYWKNPDSTADTVRDGWLYTGDMGYMGKDGFLYVLGRFKSLLISSDGEKYSPEGMEEAIVDKSPLIDQIILYNNQCPYTTAVVVPNKDALKRELKEVPAEEQAEAAAKLIGGEIDKYRKGGIYGDEVPHRWLPGALAIVDEAFTEKNGLVNSTMKIVRNKVESYFKARIDDLYTAEGKKLTSAANITSIKKLLGL
ncbi:MAG: AMP-binding protein [Alistipes sp.]|nr:AMP-binding protein [Alistipes sp.]